MLEDSLKKAFQDIFKIKKVTFDDPGAALEQDTIWVTIENSNPKIQDSKEIYRATGSVVIYAPNEQLPFGFVAKAIKQASNELTKPFFFSNVENNTKTYRNVIGRGFDFVYFYHRQYDPNKGNITSVDLTIEET